MTPDNNGWPDKPGVPPNEGWWWILLPLDVQGIRYFDGELWRIGGQLADPKDFATYALIGPVLTPAEVDARVEEARRDALEEAARWHDEQASKAQKLSDMKVSALDSKVWGDYAQNHREYATAIRALSDTPPDMVMVPREPTSAMIEAGFLVGPQAFKNRKTADWWPSDVTAIYSAMVKAARKGEGDE
jgi:hypothetical protein